MCVCVFSEKDKKTGGEDRLYKLDTKTVGEERINKGRQVLQGWMGEKGEDCM